MPTQDYHITKSASSDLNKCENIMRRIYEENPKHWPNGLNTGQLAGGLYMIREASSREPVGFVGWQEVDEGMRKVGYYSIGILPEHRQQHFAKQAVNLLIADRSAGVDEVRAMIHISNQPSMELARSVNVPIEKVALTKVLRGLSGAPRAVGRAAMSTPGAGVITAGALDAAAYGGDSWTDWLMSLPGIVADPDRLTNTAMNFGLGAGGRHVARRQPYAAGKNFGKLKAVNPIAVTAGATMAGLAPAKDFYLKGTGAIEELPAHLVEMAKDRKNQMMMLGALGIGGLGLYGYNSFKKRREQEVKDQGRVRVTLPTSGPDDAETEVEFPFAADSLALSNALQGSLGRDVRRRLRDEAHSRVRRRGSSVANTALKALT